MIHERLAIVAGLVRLPRYWHPLMYLDLREKPFSNIKYGTLHPDWVEFVGICNAGTLKDNPGNELMHRIKVAQEVLTEASKAIKGLTKEPAPASELDWVQKLWQKVRNLIRPSEFPAPQSFNAVMYHVVMEAWISRL